MDDSDPVTELIRRWRAGDPAAFDRIFAHYARSLARVAEHHLSRRLARRVHRDDIVQSVFRTFFRRGREGTLRVHDSAHLWQLLVRMTVFKVRAKWREHTADRRDLRAEEADGGAWLAEAAAGEPGPEEAAALVDLMEAMVRGLEPLHARVLELLVEGQSLAEAAKTLGKTRQCVYRVRDLLEARLRQAAGDAG